MSRDDLTAKTKEVLTLLVERRYDALELLTGGIRLSKKQIASAIFNYGRHLVSPPPEGFQLMEIIEARDAKPRRWSVVVPLWTVEEGRSDLTVELTLVEDDQSLKVELDDIHVL